MKMNLFYKDILLGCFTILGPQLFYTSNSMGENEFFETRFNCVLYDLKDSDNRLIEELPGFLSEYESMLENSYISKQAGICEIDSFFEKIYKIAKLPTDTSQFNLKSIC